MEAALTRDTRFDPSGVHAIREAPPGPRLGCEHIALILVRAWVSITGPGGSPATRPLLADPRGSSAMQALLSGMCLGRRPPLSGHVGAPMGASDFLWAGAATFGLRGWVQGAPGATKAPTLPAARPAVYPAGPAAFGYDAVDDMTTSRPLGCMHPRSSSVGQGGKG